MKKILSIILSFALILSVMSLCDLEAKTASAATNTKLVAITFDDGPSGYTTSLLDGLKSRGAKATFFVVGNRVDAYAATVRRIVDEGHQLANHTYSHPNLNTLSYSSVTGELSRTENKLKAYGGEQTYCIRPPYGNYNSNVRNAANGALILWSVDTLDWQSRNADAVYNKIVSQTRDGSIVLLHDLYRTSVQGALRAIDTLQAQGYEFVTVNELFRRRCVTLETGKAYSAAYNYGITLPAYEIPATPEIKVENIVGGKKVSISCTTADATIYYTTDGTTPNENSKKYTGAFTLTTTTTIRAVAYNYELGGESKRSVWVEKAASPAVAYSDGKLTLTPASDTTVYYTTDGSKPTASSSVYTAPISFFPTCKVLVRAVAKADRYTTYTVTEYGKLYTDISASLWYYDAVGEAEHRGIMTGTSATEFSPTNTVNRAMFVTALYRLSPDAGNTFAGSSFADCQADSWYSAAVNWASEKGIVEGFGDGTYRPNSAVTREQMCCIIARYLAAYDIELPLTERTAFADRDDISNWAVENVDALYQMGLINGMGDNMFSPRASATRAQCAKLLVALDDKCNI